MSFSVKKIDEKKVFLRKACSCWHKNLKTFHILCSFAWEKTHHRLLISQWKRSSMSRKSFSIINYFGLLWPYLKIIYPCITDTLPVHSEPPTSTSSHWYLGKYMFVIAQQFLSAGWRVSAWWLVTISHDKWKWDREIKLESLSKANSRKY